MLTTPCPSLHVYSISSTPTPHEFRLPSPHILRFHAAHESKRTTATSHHQHTPPFRRHQIKQHQHHDDRSHYCIKLDKITTALQAGTQRTHLRHMARPVLAISHTYRMGVVPFALPPAPACEPPAAAPAPAPSPPELADPPSVAAGFLTRDPAPALAAAEAAASSARATDFAAVAAPAALPLEGVFFLPPAVPPLPAFLVLLLRFGAALFGVLGRLGFLAFLRSVSKSLLLPSPAELSPSDSSSCW